MAAGPAKAPAMLASGGWTQRLLAKIGPDKLKFSTDVIYATLSQVLGRGSLILASLVVANYMAAKSFALFTYFNLTIAMIATFSTLGLGVAASRIFAESTVTLDEAKRRQLRTVLALALGTGVIAVVVLHLLPSELVLANLQINRGLLYGAVLCVTISNVLMGALSGRGEFKTMAVSSIASLAVLMTGVGIAASLNNTDVAILAVLVSMLVQIGIFFVVLRPLLKRAPGEADRFVSLSDVINVVHIAGPMFFTSLIVGSVFWVLGRIILLGDTGTSEFSKFAVGLQWFSFILLVPAIVTRVFFPRIVRAAAANSGDSKSLVLKNAGANLCIAITAGAATLLFSEFFLGLYGNQDVTSPEAFTMFVLAAIVASPVNGLGNSIIARDPGPRKWLMLQVAWCLLVVFGALYFFSEVTAANAGASLLLAYCCLVPASLMVLRHQKLV